MKFFKKKSTSNLAAADTGEVESPRRIFLEYFGNNGELSKRLFERNGLSEDQDVDRREISDRAMQKYGVQFADLDVNNATWFPRLTSYHRSKEETDSVKSFDSDASVDGFSGPFSWDTKSIQEMTFPPTPERQRKTIIDPEDTDEGHRMFETPEELRQRLKANYLEAKRQRKKYLNLNADQTDEERREKSLNGTRRGVKSTIRVVAKPSLESSKAPKNFDDELATAVKKHTSVALLTADDSVDNKSQDRSLENNNTSLFDDVFLASDVSSISKENTVVLENNNIVTVSPSRNTFSTKSSSDKTPSTGEQPTRKTQSSPKITSSKSVVTSPSSQSVSSLKSRSGSISRRLSNSSRKSFRKNNSVGAVNNEEKNEEKKHEEKNEEKEEEELGMKKNGSFIGDEETEPRPKNLSNLMDMLTSW